MSPTISGTSIFAGPNVHLSGRCAVVRIDWGDAGREQPLEVPAWLPEVVAAYPLLTVVQGRSTSPEQAIASLATSLQRAVGHPLDDVGEGDAGSRAGAGPAGRVIVPLWDIEIGLLAAQTACDALVPAIASRGGGPAAEAIRLRARAALDRYFALVKGINYSDSARRLIGVAERRGIPWARLLPGQTMLSLGQGVRQRSLMSSYTPQTSFLAAHLATHKDLAAALLRRQGLPVPPHRRVRSVEEAVRAAAGLGFPVVVKPAATDFGTAVSMNIRDEAALRRAYAAAARHGQVLVERQIAGDHTRLLVIQGRFLSAVRQDPAQVTGDGDRTVRSLIERLNAGRTAELSASFKKITLDEEADELLRTQDLTLDSVPAAGRKVVLRHTSNVSRGGTTRNVTGIVHPDNARLAERAAMVVGLDVAGVDLIMPDIRRSFREVGGAICEINPGPGLYMREADDRVEEALFDGLFGVGGRGRIPILCLLTDDEGAAAAVIADLVSRIRPHVPGLAVVRPGRAAIGDWPVTGGRTASAAARLVLADPATPALVIQLTRQAILEQGLPFDACDVAVVLPPQGRADGAGPDQAEVLLRRCALACVDGAGRDAVAVAAERFLACAVSANSPDGL